MSKRWKYFCVMLLLGDGMMAAIRPKQAAKAWVAGPKAWRNLMEHLVEHPELTRAIGLAEAAAAIWWALQNEKEVD